MSQQIVWQKKCPLCGHPALEHKTTSGNFGFGLQIVKPGAPPRFCNHPMPVAGKADSFTFCDCRILAEEYTRVGNFALIRADAKKAK